MITKTQPVSRVKRKDGAITFRHPTLTPLLWRSLNPLGLLQPYYRDDIQCKAADLAIRILNDFERAGASPLESLKLIGVSAEFTPNHTDTVSLATIQISGLQSDFDLFVAGGINGNG